MAAAAALGGWIGEAVVGKLVDIVSSYLKDQISWDENVKSALRKLEAALLPIRVVLERAEKVELNLDQNRSLGEWIWKLRDAVEEAEDVLDEMEYNRLERQISKRDPMEVRSPVGIFQSMCSWVRASCSTSLNKFMKIGKDPIIDQLNAVVEQLELVNKGINDFNIIINNSPLLLGGNNSNTRYSRETGHINTDEVVGRDKDKKKVLKWLTKSGDDFQNSQNISALTIWGVGGLGKTTLAQSVYNDDSLNFEVKMWLCVSNNNLDMEELMKKAIETTTGNLPTATSLSSRQEELKEIVKSKKCLLVLDDVWDGQENQNQQQWENFVGILSQYAERGSKILVTSRMQYQGLPKRIRNDFLPLGCLNQHESLSLFYKHAFVGVNPNKHTNLKSVGDKIAKKCGGLPLALKITGGLLNTNLDISYWLSVLEKNVLNLEENINSVKEVLKLSYKCLPSNLQACFRICSLFPQDYEFKEDELVEVWMGLGCINQCSDENIQPEDIGRYYLNILVRRSFFTHSHKIKTFTMHDLLHDLARDASTGECLRVEGNKSVTLPQTLRHLFVDQLNSDLIDEIYGLKRLRTLAVNYRYRQYLFETNLPDCGELNDNLKQLKSLHAFFISTKTMPDLAVIEQLRHLRLFQMNVDILNKPLKPLYKLYQLQNLKCKELLLNDARDLIEYDGIDNLVKLRHLVLPRRIFDKITQLRHLIALQEVQLYIRKDNAPSLRDLKDLNKLRCLYITIIECETAKIEEAKEANIEKKEHLETLTLSLHGRNHDFQFHEQLCNCLKPRTQSKITDLKVVYYSGVKAPSWMTSHYLPYVTHLELSKWENLEHLPTLGQLPTLKVLTLEKIARVKQLSTEFFGRDDIGGFPSLEELQIKEMENWEEWTRVDNTNWFPCLKEIYIRSCQKLKELPALPVCLKKLKLESVGLIGLPTWQDTNEHEVSTSHSNIPLLEDLWIDKCHELTNVQQFLSKCVSLEKMHIKDCKSLKELPALPPCLKIFDLQSVGLSSLPAWHDANNNGACPSLEQLFIKNCEELVHVQPLFLRKCASLKDLTIVMCPRILYSDISNPSQVTSSICLDLFDDLSSLTTLHIGDFAGIRTLNCLKGLSLKILMIEGCKNLISLDGLKALKSLNYLSITKCNNIITSSSAESFHQTHSPFSFLVKGLDIDNILLLQIEPLRSMKSVERLRVKGDVHASWVPHQWWLLQNHISLESLVIWNCPALESLPDELPSSLAQLRIGDCPRLKSLPESMPSSLKELRIQCCPRTELLPNNIPSSLVRLEIRDCELLKSLPERTPSSLKMFGIAHCPLVELLPNSILTSLEDLQIYGCPLLAERYKRDGGSDWPKIAHIPKIRIQ